MSIQIRQSTQFKIRNLSLVTKVGTFQIGSIFDEINIFDSMLTPCMSGNIVIRDAVGLSEKLFFDGSEYLNVDISKGDEDSITNLKRTFRIYKQTDRKNINQTSEMYVLHFMSEEFIYSEQQKINQAFTGTYHQIATSILTNYLNVPAKSKKIGVIEPTKGLHKFIVPNLSPFDSMNWLAKRAVNNEGLPNYVFFQNILGYNFVSLSNLLSKGQIASINFNPKNLGLDENQEIIGARDVKIISQFNLPESIRNGVYAGKFIGFDILTRQLNINEIDFLDVYAKGKHSNKYPNITAAKNRNMKNAGEMYNSKITLYPFATPRLTDAYTKKNDNETSMIIDDTDNYVFQRRAILSNLMQTRIQVTLPGNFSLSSGLNVLLKMPSRSIADDSNHYDKTTYGKYLIVGTRHIIKYDKHETIIEVATDSTNRELIRADNGGLRMAATQ